MKKSGKFWIRWANVGDTILREQRNIPTQELSREKAKIVNFPLIFAKDGSAVDFQYYFKVLSVDMAIREIKKQFW
jgi:hypothetical protein